MVTIRSVAFTPPTGMTQERTTSPLMCTEHAPHWATPQPYFVPVRPTGSRITQSSGVSSSTFTSRTLPLIFSFAIDRLPRWLAAIENGGLTARAHQTFFVVLKRLAWRWRAAYGPGQADTGAARSNTCDCL